MPLLEKKLDKDSGIRAAETKIFYLGECKGCSNSRGLSNKPWVIIRLEAGGIHINDGGLSSRELCFC